MNHTAIAANGFCWSPSITTFFVDEHIEWLPEGDKFLWLCVSATEMTTEDIRSQLAKIYRCKSKQIGYCGKKDKYATTTQWFSVPKDRAIIRPTHWPFDVQSCCWSAVPATKSRHKGNAFRLIVQYAYSDSISALQDRLSQAASVGFLNLFGPQRFGNRGSNVALAETMLRSPKRSRRTNRQLLLSAWQSHAFNQFSNLWNQAGRPESRQRWHEVHRTFYDQELYPDGAPTGPMFGKRSWPERPEIESLENQVLAQMGWTRKEFAEACHIQALSGTRRPLLIQPSFTAVKTIDDQYLELSFQLPAGAYATSFVQQLLELT